MNRCGATLGLALLLAGCGSAGSVKDAGTGQDWAIDACKTLPAAAAGKAAGLAVTEAKASPGASAGTAHVSSCSYMGSAGESFTVLLRQSPDSTLEEAITGLKAAPDMTGPIDEVPVSAGKGFWAPKLKTFTLLPDGTRLISVTPPGVRLGGKSDPDDILKQRAQAIAEAAAKAG